MATAKGQAEANGTTEQGRDLASLLGRAEAARQEIDREVPLLGTVRLRPMLRAEQAELPIDENTDAEQDQLHIVAATVVNVEALDEAPDADGWGQFRDAAPLGVWGSLVTVVMEANGLGPGFLKSEGARFRSG